MNTKKKYLFVDFDGTIRDTIPDPTEKNPNDRRPPFEPEEVKIRVGMSEALKKWRNKGWFIVGVSNQSGVEKEQVTADKVVEVAKHTMDLLDVHFPFYYAPHKRKGTPEQLSLRKPDIGMAKLAFQEWGEPNLEESLMVGDYKADEEFAKNLGIAYVDVNDFVKEQEKNE